MAQHKPLKSVTQWREQNRLAFERAERTVRAATSISTDIEVSITTPDGGVTVEVQGDSRLRKITLDPDVYDEYEPDQLADQVISGIAAARREAKRLQFETFRSQFRDGKET